MDAQTLPPADPRVLGARLRQAREDRGLTQDQVAQHLRVARTTVVAMEKGERKVKAEELVELASFYGRRLSALLQQGPPLEGFTVQLRGGAAADAVPAELEPCVEEFQALCEDYLRLEALRGSPVGRQYPPQYEVEQVEPSQGAEYVAAEERRRLGLGDGPLFNLREVLEDGAGLRVFLLQLPPKVEAMYAFTEESGGCVALNQEHAAERRRLSLAHEYGHFLTRRFRSEVLAEERYERRPHLELFADAFARAFLLPVGGLRRRFLNLRRERKGNTTRSDLCRLAFSFDVSVETMVRRLEEIQLLPAGLWDRLRSEGFKVEKAMRILGLEGPARQEEMLPAGFRALAVEAWQEGDLSEGQLARILRVNRLKAREITQTFESLSREDEEAQIALGAPVS